MTEDDWVDDDDDDDEDYDLSLGKNLAKGLS